MNRTLSHTRRLFTLATSAIALLGLALTGLAPAASAVTSDGELEATSRSDWVNAGSDCRKDGAEFQRAWVRVDVPGAKRGARVFDVGQNSPGDSLCRVNSAEIGDVSFAEANPSVFAGVGGVPNPDETAILRFVTARTTILAYEGDDVHYPQIFGGAPISPTGKMVYDQEAYEASAYSVDPYDTSAITGVLIRGSHVTGKVVLANGGDLAQASVRIVGLEPANPHGWWGERVDHWEPLDMEVTLEADGSFRAGPLPPGLDYTVSVVHPDYVTTWLGGAVSLGDVVAEDFSTFTSAASDGTVAVGDITLTEVIGRIVLDPEDLLGADQEGDFVFLLWDIKTGEVNYLEPEDSQLLSEPLFAGAYAISAYCYTEDGVFGAWAVVEVEAGKTTTVDLVPETVEYILDLDLETFISGDLAVGETVKVDSVDEILDDITDWLGAYPEYSRTAWIRDGQVVGIGETRTLTKADLGKKLTAVTFSAGDGFFSLVPAIATTEDVVGPGTGVDPEEPVDPKPPVGPKPPVDPKPPVAPGKPVAPKPPVDSGKPGGSGSSFVLKLPKTARVGTTLRASVRTPGAAASFQWYRGGVPISGAKGSAYALTVRDLGKQVSVKTTFTIGSRQVSEVSSTLVKTTKGKLGKIKASVKGALKAGKPVKAKVKSKTKKVKVSYQWYVGGKKVAGKAGKKAIFKVKTKHEGKKVYVKVKVKKAGYKTVTKKSKTKTIRAR